MKHMAEQFNLPLPPEVPLPPCLPVHGKGDVHGTVNPGVQKSGSQKSGRKGSRAACNGDRRSPHARDRRNPWKKILGSLKNSRATVRKSGMTTKGSMVQITAADLEAQFERQRGRCFWLGIKVDPMDAYTTSNALAPSVDRLDNSQGYVTGNFVITCRFANLGRGWLSVEEFGPQVREIRKMVSNEMWPTFLFDGMAPKS